MARLTLMLLTLLSCVTAYGNCTDNREAPDQTIHCSDDLRSKIDPVTHKAILSHTPSVTAPIRLFFNNREEPGADFTITGNVVTLGAQVDVKGNLHLDYEADVREREVVVASPRPIITGPEDLARALTLFSLTREEAAYENSRREGRKILKDNVTQHSDTDRPSAAATPRSLYLLESYAEANQRSRADSTRLDRMTSRELSVQGLDGLGDGVLTRVFKQVGMKHSSPERQSSQAEVATDVPGDSITSRTTRARTTWLLGDRIREDAREGTNK